MGKLRNVGGVAALLAAASLAGCSPPAPAKPAVDTGKIADAVKADVAQNIADFNAHDATKVASHDATDVVQMGHGAPNTVGPAADLDGSKTYFAANPNAHVTDANAVVDVAASGDMAVYRSTYTLTQTDPKTKRAVTETGNYLAGYKQQADGSWKLAWSDTSDTPPVAAAKPS